MLGSDWVIGEGLSRKVTFKLILERQEGTTVCSSERVSRWREQTVPRSQEGIS